MPSRLNLPTPADFVLARDACSYGYFLLHPNHWDPRARALSRVLILRDGPAHIRITQAHDDGLIAWQELRGRPLLVASTRTLSRPERAHAIAQITRMLRLDEPAEHIADFHRRDPRWKSTGRGRLFRSPTMFEDVIKTVTSCNVQWPSTITMNRRLCEVVGDAGSFPSSAKIARTRPQTLRARCRTGYRDARIIQLARLFTPRGKRPAELDPDWFEDPATPDEAVRNALLDLPGIGPYAAANIMQLLGRYAHLPLDTESVRHGRTILGFDGSDKQVLKQIDAHFEPFGPHRFRSYWFELWRFYEAKRGRADTWDRDTTGSTFTASQF